jgi:hypothetical protein
VIRTVARSPVAVAVQRIVAWEEAIQGRDEIGVRAGPNLDDDQAGCGVGNEDRQETLARPDLVEKCLARAGEVRQTATGTSPNRDFAAVYGKMLRRASRSRPSPPRAGADS